MNATYLFQQDKHYDIGYDTGDKAMQCGRHVDVFKVWLMWRAKVLYYLNLPLVVKVNFGFFKYFLIFKG